MNLAHKLQQTFLRRICISSSSSLQIPSSRGLTAGSSDVEKILDPAVKPREDAFQIMRENAFQIICKHALIFLFCAPAFALKPLSWETTQHTAVLFYETHAVPMVTLSVAFKAGSAYDQAHEGLAALTTSMLNQGNAGYSASQIANQFADQGTVFNSTTTKDMAAFSLTSLADSLPLQASLKTFKLILNHPVFSALVLSQEKNQQLAALLSERESPQSLANDLFFKTLYPHHPYGHPVLGTEASLKQLAIQDVRHFYKRYFVPANAVIVIVGALSSDQAHQLSEHLFENRSAGQPAPAIPTAMPLTHALQKHRPYPASQTTLFMGQLGITHHDPHYFPLIVGNYILGGGSLVSRLAEALREKRGLTYHVSSELMPMPGRGPFLISLATQHQQAKVAEQLAQQLLTTFIKTGPSEQELAAAKRYLIGSFPLSLASNTDIASLLLRIAFYKLPLDFLDHYAHHIQTVTASDIQHAFQQLITPERLLIVSVGPDA